MTQPTIGDLLKQIGIKFLVLLQSRKFWVTAFGVGATIAKMNANQLDSATGMVIISGLLVAFAGLTAWEDNNIRKAQIK